MRIATWNVNSVRARHERLLAWLERAAPDVLCLQEVKAPAADFPHAEVEALGYRSLVHGQRTYNGVAILSREEATDPIAGMPDREEPMQARYLSATVAGVRVVSAYVPVGSEVGSEKWAYKLEWYGRLRQQLRAELAHGPLALCGDLNVALDDADVANPEEWRDCVLTHPEAREALREVLSLGLEDPVRARNPEGGVYSWWDYRQLRFPRNDGLRIDHVLLTPDLARGVTAATTDRNERKGEKPSDHVPVVVDFERA